MPKPTTTGATPTRTRATSTAPSPTTTRRSGSTPNTPSPTTAAATPTTKGRIRPRHRRLRRGDPARPKFAHAYNNRGSLRRKATRPRHRRLQRGDPARSQAALAYYNRGNVYKTSESRPRHRGFRPGDPARPQLRLSLQLPRHRLPRQGRLDRAIADYNEAIRLDPKYAFAYNGRGQRLQR